MNRLQEHSMISSEEIYEDLLKKIVNCEYLPGDAVSENELCAVYGCTRHMVRGAFAKLREKGLLEVYPQRGSFVSLIDLNKISDILVLREATETSVVIQIIGENDGLEELTVLLQKMISEQKRAYAKGKDYLQEYFYTDDLFHQVLLDKAGRGGIGTILDDAYLHLRRWRNLEVRTTGRVPGLIGEHQAICDAVKARDTEKAIHLLHEHFDTVKYAASVDEGRDTSYFYR
ncbi:MAG: GntR family transcriptional regulator [Erysipelotrichaceae bacterium]|nr:GntR family transcriptional regulator [Erysipelotrichaceae bacterium]